MRASGGSGPIDVDPRILYLFGTAALWAGWILFLRAVLFGLKAVFDPGAKESASGKAAAANLGGAAISFLAYQFLMPGSTQTATFDLPIVWIVMPFMAWASVVCLAMAIGRGVQALLALSAEETQSRLIAAGIWFVLAAGTFFLFYRSGDPVEVLRGSIPLTPVAAGGLLLLIIATLATIVLTNRRAASRGIAKGAANHLALLVGSVVFGLPFAWLLITSFKEDRDMSSPTGLVWIPRVQETVPFFDPDDPIIEGTYQGVPAEGPIIQRHPDGSATVEIYRPAVLRGLTFHAPAPLKIVPKQIPVVTASYKGETVRGKVVKELEDGSRRVEVMSPAGLKGERFESKPEDLTFVRHVGLKWMNYPEALDYLPRETEKGLVYLKNTLILVVLNVIGTLLSSSIAAYAFARLRFPGKNAIFIILLSTMMLPAAVTLIPQFLIFRSLGWIDTLRPLWFTAFLGSAFNIFLLRQFFMGIPMELEDAAKIDGCNYLRTFWQVMLPQVKPALAVVAIWTFMGAWNNFMGPLIYINSPENMPISYALQLFQGDRVNEPGLLMAFATLTMLPVLLVFFFAQKYFIEGVTLSGLGGR